MVPRALVTLFFVTVLSVRSFAQEGFETNFDVISGWTLQSTDANVKWSIKGGALPPKSPPVCLNYNNGTNYDSGAKNSGSATSPFIYISGVAVLTFWCNYQTETTGTDYDKRFLRIFDKKGTKLAEYQLAGAGGSTEIDGCSQMETWHQHTVDLSAFSSSSPIQIQFFFDSVDGVANNYAGWFIDDMKVVSGGQWFTRWSDDIETNAGWTLDPGSPVAWDFDAVPATVGNGGEPSVKSGTKSLNYNGPATYNSGAANKGTATSPMIDLTGQILPRLRIWCAFDTEIEVGYDQRTLQVVSADGSNSYETYQFIPKGAAGMPVGRGFTCPQAGKWHEHVIPLKAEWGLIRLKFKFDTIDNFANDYAGWFLDSFVLESWGTPQDYLALSPAVGQHEKYLSGILCYVATATYGSPRAPEVQSLESFRDKSLSTSSIGRAFLKVYEAKGPILAEQVRRSETARTTLQGVLGVVTRPAGTVLFVLALSALGIALVRRAAVR